MLEDIDFAGCDTLFLDRDGVINRHRPNDYVKTWNEFEFLPGVLESLGSLSKKFKHIIIVTNQRGVGKGLMTEQALQEIHELMVREIEKYGGRIDRIYYCTDLISDSYDRKPNIGMALRAKKDFPEIDFSKSVMIGDSKSDVEFGERAGIKLCLRIKST